MKVVSKNTRFSEYSPKLKNYGQVLLERGEIDRSIFGLIPEYSAAFALKAKMFRAYSSDIKTLSTTDALIAEEVGSLVGKMLNFDLVNIVEITMDNNACKSLPFVFELFEYDKMGSFNVVGVLDKNNQEETIRDVKEAAVGAGYKLKTNYIRKNLLHEDILEESKNLKKDDSDKNVCNLFLVLGSQIGRLGHGIEDNNLLHNISKSMTENDYLIVLNQVFDSNNMDHFLREIKYLIKNVMFKNTQILASMFNSQAELSAKHSLGHTGLGYINMYTVSQEPVKIFGLDIEENREITVLRWNCLSDTDLKIMFRRQNLRLIQCAYTPKENHGIYFLEKRY